MKQDFHIPMLVARHLFFLVLPGAWFWFMWTQSAVFASLASSVAFAFLIVVTVASLVVIYSRNIRLSAFEKVVVSVGLAFVLFVIWGQTLSAVPLSLFPEDWPRLIWRIGLFLPALFSGIVASFILVVPLSLYLRSSHWVVPLLAAIPVVMLQLDAVFGESTRALTRSVVIFEILVLLLLVPCFVEILRRLAGYFHRLSANKALNTDTGKAGAG